MLEQSIHWVEAVTAVSLFSLIVALIIIGALLRLLVKREALLAKDALRIIGTISQVVGGLLGSVGILIVLVILFPKAAEWIVNSYMPKTIIWQTNFQTWLTQRVSDTRTATAMGLILKSFSLGSALLGFVCGQFSKGLFSLILGRSYHYKVHVSSLGQAEPQAMQAQAQSSPRTLSGRIDNIRR